MNWGSVGANKWWKLPAGNPPRYGVRRVVRGVECRPLPTGLGKACWEALDDEEEGCYFMALPVTDGREPIHETFRDLYLRLNKPKVESENGSTANVAGSPKSARDLATLDRAIDMLLATAAGLHKVRIGIGLLHPENVLLVSLSGAGSSGVKAPVDDWPEESQDSLAGSHSTAAGEQLVLPDANCVWHSYLSPNEPDWITNVRWKNLWDRDPIQINKSLIDGKVEVLADIRTLARLIAYMLVGDGINHWADGQGRLSRVPKTSDCPETGADIWRAIDEALTGQIETIEDFRRRLQKLWRQRGNDKIGPMAWHYLQPPPPRPLTAFERFQRAVKRTVVGTAVLAGLAIVSLAIWYFAVLQPEAQRKHQFEVARAAADEDLKKAVKTEDLATAHDAIDSVNAIPPSFFGDVRSAEEEEKARLKRDFDRRKREIEDSEAKMRFEKCIDDARKALAIADWRGAVKNLVSAEPLIKSIAEKDRNDATSGLEQIRDDFVRAYDASAKEVITKLSVDPPNQYDAAAR